MGDKKDLVARGYNSGNKQEVLPNAVYSFVELEELLGITRRVLGICVKHNSLRPINFGNKYRFLGSEVLRFLKERML